MQIDSTKKVLSIKKNQANNMNNNNIIISQLNRNNQCLEEKKIETYSNCGTSDYSQKAKIEEKKIEKEKCLDNINIIPTIDINSLNILLNKEQLYGTFLLFQQFLSATQTLTIDSNKENNINYTNNNTIPINKNVNNDFISTINNIKEIIVNKENINNNVQNTKKIQFFNPEKNNNEISSNKTITSNFQKYNKNFINKIRKYPNESISLMKSNINDSKTNNIGSNNVSDKESSKKIFIKSNSKLFSSNRFKSISQENIKELKDINCSKINSKNNNESFIQNKKNLSNDYSFDFSNNNIDSYSYSIGDSLQIMTSDLFRTKKIKNNIDSIRLIQNYNKTSRTNDINKINYNLNNNNIRSARLIRNNNYIESYNKDDELIKKIKIKVTKNKDDNYNKNNDLYINNINDNYKNNKEQIIEAKIKELNEETIKFREERDKIIKLKQEYEKLHEKLISDIESFNEKKEQFEKYRIEELNKIKEEKKNISIQSNIFTNLKLENQSLNISNKNDKEVINNLRNYITQLKSIIKKKDEEIKILTQNNKNTINNYVINSYKSLGLLKDENVTKFKKFDNKYKTFRNSILIKNNLNEKGYMTHYSCSKIKNSLNCNEKNIINKSNSLINFNIFSRLNDNKKGRNYMKSEQNNIEHKLNSYSGNIFNSQLKINTSINSKKQKIKLDILPKKISDIKEKKAKNNHHKKLSSTITNLNIKDKITKKKDEKNSSKILNNSTYNNKRYSHEFSKTSSNFLNQKHKKNKKVDNRNYKDKILENFNENKRSLSNEKLKLSNEYMEELNKPLNKEEYDFIIPEKYSKNNYKLIKKNIIQDKEICIYTNNKKVITFPSGLKKEIYNDGFQLVYFNNGDMKQNYLDGKSKYFFKDANTVQTSYPNGIQIFKFYNGQIEKHFPNGLKKIFFPNGTIDYIFDNQKEENINDEKEIEQIEI